MILVLFSLLPLANSSVGRIKTSRVGHGAFFSGHLSWLSNPSKTGWVAANWLKLNPHGHCRDLQEPSGIICQLAGGCLLLAFRRGVRLCFSWRVLGG